MTLEVILEVTFRQKELETVSADLQAARQQDEGHQTLAESASACPWPQVDSSYCPTSFTFQSSYKNRKSRLDSNPGEEGAITHKSSPRASSRPECLFWMQVFVVVTV